MIRSIDSGAKQKDPLAGSGPRSWIVTQAKRRFNWGRPADGPAAGFLARASHRKEVLPPRQTKPFIWQSGDGKQRRWLPDAGPWRHLVTTANMVGHGDPDRCVHSRLRRGLPEESTLVRLNNGFLLSG
jgi:hypothetical protein